MDTCRCLLGSWWAQTQCVILMQATGWNPTSLWFVLGNVRWICLSWSMGTQAAAWWGNWFWGVCCGYISKSCTYNTMVSTLWLCGLCVAHGILNAVARSWTEEDESCNGQGLLLLQMGGDRVAGVGRLQFQEPNLNRWMVQFFLATILVGSMILFCCFVPRTGTETAAGAALVDKLRPHLESSDCKTFNDYVAGTHPLVWVWSSTTLPTKSFM